MKLRLLYHGHCFDGVASAATFTRFYKERIHPEAEVNYTGLLHRPGNLFDHSMFDSDENAIVDFKYAASEKLTWWFDHHESAFLTPEDEAHFRADKSGRKFLDATRKSCTEFIADVARERFGFDDDELARIQDWVVSSGIHWGLYDAARAPGFIKGIAQALPLKHLIDGLSGAMVKGTSIATNISALGVIAAWAVLGIALAIRGFSWEQRRS